MISFIRNTFCIILLGLLLQSCGDESACHYLGDIEDIVIDYRFLSMTSGDKHLIELEVTYDKIETENILYKWELNGLTSDQKTMVLTYEGPLTGFLKIKNAEDDCFLYKELFLEIDLAGCCDYLGDEDYMEVYQDKFSSCEYGNNWVLLQADFKGPSNMDLIYEWTIDGQEGRGSEMRVDGNGLKEGQLKVMNPVDSCYMIKPLKVDLTFGGASVGSQVWVENINSSSNQLDVFDSTDEGIEDILVELYSYPEEELLQSVLTDRLGRYVFQYIPIGEYVIKVNKPENYLFVQKDEGEDDTKDSDFNTEGFSDPFSIDECEIDLTIDAGLRPQ